MEVRKTTNYDQFIFRNDNRAAICPSHVEKIMRSIESKNLLEYRPICVNEKFEVLDGQHRLLAAKKLGVDIYYMIQKESSAGDIIRLNVSKQWSTHDYLNFYVSQGNIHYINLKNFQKTHNLPISVAINIVTGHQGSRRAYKEGRLIYNPTIFKEHIINCWETVNYIKRVKGNHAKFTENSRFWSALLKLTRHKDFDPNKWFKNLEVKIYSMGPKADGGGYIVMIQDIYNFQNRKKIDLLNAPHLQPENDDPEDVSE